MQKLFFILLSLLSNALVYGQDASELKTETRIHPVKEEAQMGRIWSGAISRWGVSYMIPDNAKFSAKWQALRAELTIKGIVLQGDFLIPAGKSNYQRVGMGYNYRLSISPHWALDLQTIVGYAHYSKEYHQHLNRRLIQKAEREIDEVLNTIGMDDYSKNYVISIFRNEINGYQKEVNTYYYQISPQINYTMKHGGSLYLGYSLIGNEPRSKNGLGLKDGRREGYFLVGWKLPFN